MVVGWICFFPFSIYGTERERGKKNTHTFRRGSFFIFQVGVANFKDFFMFSDEYVNGPNVVDKTSTTPI